MGSKGDLQAGDVRDAIFAAYIRQRYAHEARKKNANLPFTLDKMLEVLGHAAMINASGGTRDDGKGYFGSKITENMLVRHDFTHHLENSDIDAFCTLACKLHILYQRDNETYSFLHLLMRDYLTYTYSIEHLRSAESYVNIDLFVNYSPTKALDGLGDTRAVEALINALVDTNPIVRRAVAEALGGLGDARAVEALINALVDTNPIVRRAVAEALGGLGDARAVEALITALADTDEQVRRIAAVVLGQLGDTRAAKPLIHALADINLHVRIEVVEALRKLGDVSAVPALIERLADIEGHEPFRVCDMVARALEEIDTLRAWLAVGEWERNGRGRK